MTSLLDKYKEIIVNRHGISCDSFMITRKIIDEINPLNTYKVSKNGLELVNTISDDSLHSIYTTIPEYYEFEGKWLKDISIDSSNSQSNEANILGGFCKFEIDLDAMQIPMLVKTMLVIIFFKNNMVEECI